MINQRWDRQDHSIKKYRKEQKKRLNEQVKQFTAFLKETQINYHGIKKTLFQSPWHLITGPQQSGQTTLLNNSEINFVFRKKQPNKFTQGEETHWWATKNAVIVDAPSDYFNLWHENIHSAWEIFLKILKKNSYQKKLSSLIIVIDYPGVINPEEKDQRWLLHNLQQQIIDVKKIFSKDVRVFIIINKIDLISGFQDFFESIDLEQRQQPWGILFDKNLSHLNLIQQFNSKFNDIIARLKNQVLHRIHRENKPYKKLSLYQFPIKFHTIKPALDKIIQELSQNHLFIDGLFFTSSHQTIQPSALSQETLPVHHRQPSLGRWYFIHDLFDDLIFDAAPTTSTNNKTLFYATTVIFIVVIITTVSFLINNFIRKSELLNRAENAITIYQLSSSQKNDPNTSFFSLDYLKNTLSMMKSSSTPKTETNSGDLKKQAQLLLPPIVQSLEKTLQNNTTLPKERYASLKAYLMLNDPDRFDKNYLLYVLKDSFLKTYPEDSQQSVFLQLSQLFDQPPQGIALNTDIITQNQNILQKLSTEDLYNVMFENQFAGQQLSLNLSTNKNAANVLTFVNQDNQISALYTLPSFEKIYPDALKQLTLASQSGDWVVGKITRPDTINEKDLFDSAEEDYLDRYVDAWSDFLDNIKIVNYTSLQELNDSLTLLSSDQSPLLQLIQLVKDNLPQPVVNKDDSLQSLMTVITQPGFNDQVKNNLTALQLTINAIVTDPNANQKAFEFTENRMRNKGQNDPIENLLSLSKQCPDPIKDWLYNIGINAWELLLNQSQQYIDDQWKKNILPAYQNQIAGRFPFSQMATNQVDINSFEHFFASNGVFDQFFSKFLYPFLDNTKTPWQTINVDGYGLPLSNQTLNQLQAIYQIQMIFFGNNQHVYIPFILQPISMEENISSVTVSIGDQTMTFQNKTPFEQKSFVWPSAYSDQPTTITLNTIDNKPIIFTSTGLWGWLKLLNQANVQFVDKPDIYQATFDKNGYSAIMGFALKQLNNPFNLKLFNNLQLPASLF